MTDSTQVEDDLPLTEATFYILLSLVPGPKHGYAIMKDVLQISEQRVVLSTGTLYGALKRLLELTWIARLDAAVDDVTQRHQKVYRLTETGRRVLQAETRRLQTLLQAVAGRPALGDL